MPLHPRLRPIVAIANRRDDEGVLMPTRRLAGTLEARRMGRVAMLRGPDVEISERLVPVAGGSIRVRLYRPPVGSGAGDRRPALHVFIHGGGWCVGDLDQRDPRCRTIAGEAGCVVASIDYRLAPENAFPTAPEDCYAALLALLEDAEGLGIDPEVVSVSGESAGANLAAVVCLMARDRNGPQICFQWLDVPATDLTMSQPSIERLGHGYVLTRAAMDAYVADYLAGADPTHPLASPLHVEDLSGLPPALIMTSELDPLRDDGVAYAAALREAGVAVEHRDLDGLFHAAFAFTRILPEARAFEVEAIGLLRRAHRDARSNS